MKEPFALISSMRADLVRIWTVLSLDLHFLTSNILFSLLISASLIFYITTVLQSGSTTVQERTFFMESDDHPR